MMCTQNRIGILVYMNGLEILKHDILFFFV